MGNGVGAAGYDQGVVGPEGEGRGLVAALVDVRGDDATSAAAERVRSDWRPAHLDQRFDLAPERMSGVELARYFLLELLGPGWDLAVATGRPGDADAGDALAEPGSGPHWTSARMCSAHPA